MVRVLNLTSSCEYRGRTVDPVHFCATNIVNRNLIRLGTGEGQLVAWGNPPASFQSVDISAIPIADGKSVADWIATYMASVYRDEGVSLPFGIESEKAEQLIDSYNLNANLCYAVVKTRGGVGVDRFFVTKSAEVLNTLSPRLAPDERKKGFGRFKDAFSNTFSELDSSRFNAVKILPDKDGFHLSKVSISTRNKISLLPVYSIANYGNAIAQFLQRNIVRLAYSVDGIPHHPIDTTLETKFLAQWLNTATDKADYWLQSQIANPLSFAYLTVPDLECFQHFVTVPVLGIKNIQAYPE